MGGSGSGEGASASCARRRRCARKWLTIAAIILFAPGCTTSLRQWVHNGFKVGPNYCPPGAPAADQWVDEVDPAIDSSHAEDWAWWTVFKDPTLDELIDVAVAQNLDLNATAARIIEARARRRIAAGNLFPQSQQGILAYAHGQTPGGLGGIPFGSKINFWADGFSASWELDLWGRLRRNIEAADANIDVALDGYGNSLVVLLSDVATNYVNLR